LRPKAKQEAPPEPPTVEAGPEPEPAVEPAPRGKHGRSATTDDDAAVPGVTGVNSATAVAPRDPTETAELEARASEMLAMLAADTHRPLGPLAARLDSTSSRAVAAAVGAVLLLLAILLTMTLLGHLV
jgi:hypothetical protein